MSKTLISTLVLAALAAPAHARPLKDMCESMEPLRKLAGFKYVKPVVRMQSESKTVKPQDIVFTIAAKAGEIRVSPSADGAIEFPLTDALCSENPDLTSNQPEGTVSLSVSIDPQIPPARTLEYRELDALRREWDEAVSRQSLLWRVLAPSAKGFHVSFEPGNAASVEVRVSSGVRKFVADANGDVYLPIDASWAAANPAVVLSEMPRRIGLRFKS